MQRPGTYNFILVDVEIFCFIFYFVHSHYELIYQYGQQKALNQPLSLQISSLERAADSRFTVTGPANDQEGKSDKLKKIANFKK